MNEIVRFVFHGLHVFNSFRFDCDPAKLRNSFGSASLRFYRATGTDENGCPRRKHTLDKRLAANTRVLANANGHSLAGVIVSNINFRLIEVE